MWHSHRVNSLTNGATVAGGAGAAWDGREEIPMETSQVPSTITIESAPSLANWASTGPCSPPTAVYKRRYVCEGLGVRDGEEHSRRRQESGHREELSEPHLRSNVIWRKSRCAVEFVGQEYTNIEDRPSVFFVECMPSLATTSSCTHYAQLLIASTI